MNSKVGFQANKANIVHQNGINLSQSQCVRGQPLLAPFLGGQSSRNRSGSIQIIIRITVQSHISTVIILGPNFHGPLPKWIPGVLR
jgi:hypothetical protein